jgi:SAM-dependent methyltransferase
LARVCDYEGSKYRTDFWEGQNREYEDQTERIAIQKLLPPQGKRIIEVGAGFGRLVDLYRGYKQIILLDYARTQLEEAQAYLGQDERFVFVVADIYRLPFVDNLFEALTMVRVMHHLADVPQALPELWRILAPQGTAVIEHASKFHLKSLLRWFMGRQIWNPFAFEPVEFVELNFDFHPAWMRHQFEAAGLTIQNIRALSYFRLNLLKRLLPTAWLVTLDGLTQPSGRWWQLSPSIFLQAIAQKPEAPAPLNFFRCPHCYATEFIHQPSSALTEGEVLKCRGCQYGWLYKDNIYDFKTPLFTP